MQLRGVHCAVFEEMWSIRGRERRGWVTLGRYAVSVTLGWRHTMGYQATQAYPISSLLGHTITSTSSLVPILAMSSAAEYFLQHPSLCLFSSVLQLCLTATLVASCQDVSVIRVNE